MYLFIIFLHSFLQTACVFQGEAVCRYGPDLVQGKVTKMEGIGIRLKQQNTPISCLIIFIIQCHVCKKKFDFKYL